MALRGTTKSPIQCFSRKKLSKHARKKSVGMSLMNLCVPANSVMYSNATHETVLDQIGKKVLEDLLVGRYGVSVPALTKDHSGIKINTPYPEDSIRRIQDMESI
ncbi:hypothetical protein Tco_1121440 [Tanacetum coccineum]|uniref:Uncharacterized protein n=1 Tax=Tanacetum coccineum TaxID=301880 RepID=A0ABQ5IXQ5_9ASTR